MIKTYNVGKNNPRYIDGRKSKKYYCKDCGVKVSFSGGCYKGCKCRSCAYTGRKLSEEHKNKLRQTRLGKKLSIDTKKKISKSCCGSKHYNWQGGITSLERQIFKTEEYKEWRIKVLKRDFYTCQECSQIGGDLEVHHKKRFTLIFREFLQKYSQFSPIEDKETLVRLAITYEPFWDIINGKTLCRECHELTFKGN